MYILQTLLARNGSRRVLGLVSDEAGQKKRGPTNLVRFTEISAQIPLCLNVKVILLTEEDHTSNGNQASKIILLCVRKVGQAKSMNLSSDLGRIIEDGGRIVKQVAEFPVST